MSSLPVLNVLMEVQFNSLNSVDFKLKDAFVFVLSPYATETAGLITKIWSWNQSRDLIWGTE
jgi:hypothetical protein